MKVRNFVSLLVVVLMTAFASSALAQTVVTNDDVVRGIHNVTPVSNNWMLYTRDGGTGTFVSGPTTPPMGTGSIQLSTPLPNDKAYLFNYDHIGTALSTIDAIGYSTYRSAGDNFQVAALNMEVDFNGPNVAGGFTTLVFEPVYNTGQGNVQTGVWQSWDALHGNWWSTKDIPGVCSFNCFVSWSDILAANPDATILGGFGINQGGGNPNLISAVDRLTLGSSGVTTTYNFEVLRAPVHVSPANGATLTTAQLDKVDWTDVTDSAGPMTYYYQSSYSTATNADGSFTSPAYSSGALSVSEIPTPGTPPGTYYWHVRAVDGQGNSSVWSNYGYFTVTPNPPPPPPAPTEASQCKNSGWMTYTRKDKSVFKNQGDCIQYVNTGK